MSRTIWNPALAAAHVAAKAGFQIAPSHLRCAKAGRVWNDGELEGVMDKGLNPQYPLTI